MMRRVRIACLLLVTLPACRLDVVNDLRGPQPLAPEHDDAGATSHGGDPDAAPPFNDLMPDDDVDAATFTDRDAGPAQPDASADQDAAPPDDTENLVAHWPLQDPQASLAADTSGTGADGTFMGGAVLSDSGLVLDGVDNCVHVPSPSLGFPGALTVTLWVRTTTTVTEGMGTPNEWWKGEWFIDKDSGQVQNGWALTNYRGRAHFNVNPDSDTLVSTTPIDDGVWHHIAGVRRSDGHRWLYVDGELQASVSSGSMDVLTNGEDLYLGCDSGTQHFGRGLLREVRVYDAELSAERVRAIMTNSAP